MAEKGKKQLLTIGITVIIIDILTTIMGVVIYSSMGNLAEVQKNITQGIVRLILTVLLAVFAYQGYNAAKVIMQVLFVISALFGLLVSIGLLTHTGLGAILLVLSVIYGVIAFKLIGSNDIKVYIKESTIKRNRAYLEDNQIIDNDDKRSDDNI